MRSYIERANILGGRKQSDLTKQPIILKVDNEEEKKECCLK